VPVVHAGRPERGLGGGAQLLGSVDQLELDQA
jgi:hypothetical protein